MATIGLLAYHDNVHAVQLFGKGKCDFCELEFKQ